MVERLPLHPGGLDVDSRRQENEQKQHDQRCAAGDSEHADGPLQVNSDLR